MSTAPTSPAPAPEIPRIKFLADAFIAATPSPSDRSCFVLGGTGETGKRLVRLLIISGAFSVIKAIVRKPVSLDYIPETPAGVTFVNN